MDLPVNASIPLPLTSVLCLLFAVLLGLAIFLTIGVRVVPENKRLAVYRLGRYVGEMGPGLIFILPFVDRGEMHDLAASPQQIPVFPGATGEAETAIFVEGKARIGTTIFDATSERPIAPGARVSIKKVTLEVEEIVDRQRA